MPISENFRENEQPIVASNSKIYGLLGAAAISALTACGAKTGLESGDFSTFDAGGSIGMDSVGGAGGDTGTGGKDTGSGGEGGEGGTPPCEKLSVIPSSTPASMTLVKGWIGKTFACWNFMNSCTEDYTLDGLTVHRYGAGNAKDLTQIYIPKVTSDYGIDPVTQNIEYKDLNFKLAGSSTTTLCVAGNVSLNPTCGAQDGFEIADSAAVKAHHPDGAPLDTSKISGPFPSQGPLHTISCSPLFSTSFDGPPSGSFKVGSASVDCLDLTTTNLANFDVEGKNWEIQVALSGAPSAAGGLLDTSSLKTVSNYTNFRIMDGAVVVMGPSELSTAPGASDSSQTITMSGVEIFPPESTKKLKVVFDVASNTAMIGDQVRCILKNLATPGKNYVRYTDGLDLDPSTISPAADISGSQFSIVP